jgi:hypothetical protein
MATPEDIRRNIQRLSSAGLPENQQRRAGDQDRVWTPAGFVEKPPGWKDGLTSQGQPIPRTGSRGGRYYEALTKDGRRYRRYF